MVVVDVRVVVLLPDCVDIAVLVREVEAVRVTVPEAVADLLLAAVAVMVKDLRDVADCVEDAELV